MGEKTIGKKALFSAIISCFMIMLLFVSLLGENNKANDLVTGFLKHIKAHEYEDAAALLSAISVLNHATSEKEFEDFAFLLELSLLSHFNLLDHDTYDLHVSRESFFLPFMEKNKIGLSVLLNEKKGPLIEALSPGSARSPVKTLFTVERINGTWKIVEINLDKTPLSETFKKLYPQLSNNPNFKITKNGFIINRIEYDQKTLSVTDKHIYRHFLRKASLLISNK